MEEHMGNMEKKTTSEVHVEATQNEADPQAQRRDPYMG